MPFPIFRVMVSSTFLDLTHERKAVVEALRELAMPLGYLDVDFTVVDLLGGASASPPLEVCLAEARRSDILVTIVGLRYGWVTPTGLSITEREYDEASRNGKSVLAYMKKPESIVLPEHRDTELALIDSLAAFKRKIDSERKRDVFSTAEELRGHVIRDTLTWVLSLPQVADSLGKPDARNQFSELKTYLEAFQSGDPMRAQEIATSRRFELDMQRFGMENLHQSLLMDLLQLGSFAEPTRVSDPATRARLLMEYVEAFGNRPTASIALQQAATLIPSLNNPRASFALARALAKAAVREHRYDIASAHLKTMLRHARQTNDVHVLAQARRPIGDFYRVQGKHERALRWYDKAVKDLCAMVEICPFCLSSAFEACGTEYRALGRCSMANDRFGKALMVAQAIPDRQRSGEALESLAEQFITHGDLRTGVAAYVWACRLVSEAKPAQEGADLGVWLGDVAARFGQERVLAVLSEIEDKAEGIVLEALAPYKLEDLPEKLGIKPSVYGDHW